MSSFDDLLSGIELPKVVRVRQTFPRPRVEDPTALVEQLLGEGGHLSGVKNGDSVAVAAGSRGIMDLPQVIHGVVKQLRQAGAYPFILPAMGSHGGATPEGQVEVLHHLGVTEESAGAPIRSSMEVVEVGTTGGGLPVYVDRLAHEADHIVVVNRIKPHVSFRGPFESGLMKMIAIGLGKQKGAEICHQLGFDTMADNILSLGREIIARERILAAVGIIENAYHETAKIVVMPPQDIEVKEPRLLTEARGYVPGFFFDRLDVLVVDEIGKDISGTGFDTNVIGRYTTKSAEANATGGPQISKIVVRALSEATGGNATGIGIADVITRQVYDRFSFQQTYPNALTSTATASPRIPMVMDTDTQAVKAAIKTCNILDFSHVRLARIRNTLSMSEIRVTENLLPEAEQSAMATRIGPPEELFDDW